MSVGFSSGHRPRMKMHMHRQTNIVYFLIRKFWLQNTPIGVCCGLPENIHRRGRSWRAGLRSADRTDWSNID